MNAVEPRPYDMKLEAERMRLISETYDYLRVCFTEHHGTDSKGRFFAMQALKEWRDYSLGSGKL